MSLAASILFVASIGAANDDLPAVVGTVVDAQNQPVAGADVYLFDGPPLGRAALFGLGGKTRQPPRLLAHTQTSDAGEFAIVLPVEAPPPGGRGLTWLAMAVHKPGLAVKTRLIGREWPARAAPLRLELVAPRDNRVRVRSPADEPVADARLWTDQIDGIPLPNELSARLAAESDASGQAELPDVTGERLRTVRIDAEGFGSQWAALGRPDAVEASTVSLSPIAAIGGQLVDDDGQALPSTRVRLTTWTEPRDELAGGGVADVTTDTDGRFQVPVMAAGMLQIAAELPPGSPLLSTYQGSQQIEAGASNDVVVRFRHGVRIHGTVVDQADRRPIAGAVVSLGLNLDAPVVETNEAGEYSGYVLPGLTYLTLARLPPDYYVPNAIVPKETIREDAKQMTFKPLVVAAGAMLSGRVVDATGKPVAEAEVVGTCPRSDIADRNVYARSDRDGNFMLPGATPNAYVKVMAFSASGITTDPAIGDAHDAEPMTIIVDPSNAVSVSGRAVDAGGRPLSGAAIRVLPLHFDLNRRLVDSGVAAFDGSERLYTDAEGRFITPQQLRPDWGYRVEVDAPGMTPVRTEPLGPTIWHTTDFGDIVLTPTPRLRAVAGQVVDESGRPLAGALVQQSGDGPRPTRATCGADGRFRIEGVYEGPAWLLVGHEGFPLQAEHIESDMVEIRIVLRNAAVVPGREVPRESSVAPADEMAFCRKLFAEHRGRFEGASSPNRQWAASIKFLLEGDFSDAVTPDVASGVRIGFALGHRALTHEQAIELAETTEDMYLRGSLCLAAFDAIGSTCDQRRDALAEALLAARAVDAPATRILLLAQIGARFFDLRDHEVGMAVVREVRDGLAAAPEGIVPNGDLWRGGTAAALVYFDLPATYAVLDDVRRPQRDWFLADVSRSLAVVDPAEAERALGKMEMPNLRYHYGVGTVHRMAAVDAERAARIARSYPIHANRAYSLGLVAEAQASTDPELAGQFVEEAYALLEQSLTEGTADQQYSTCGTAASLLVIVERVKPALLDHYLARALAMRPPRPARGDPLAVYESEVAQMALAIVPYDRQAARALLEPLAPRIRTLSTVGEQYAAPGQIWAAFALTDSAWARELVESLPNAPPDAAFSPRATAAKHVIDALVHCGVGRWPWVYWRYLHARHPDTPVRER